MDSTRFHIRFRCRRIDCNINSSKKGVVEMTNEEINKYLVDELMLKYPVLFDKVLRQDMCDIDLEFLGFVDTYYYLSKIIPKHWRVIDFGCAYNPQAYFFKDHKCFIGVNPGIKEQFRFSNTILFKGTISKFLEKKPTTKEVFAICNNVPSKETRLIREYYPNCFVYYTTGPEFKVRLSKKGK